MITRLFKRKKPAKIAWPESRKKLQKAIKQCEHLAYTTDGKDIYLYIPKDKSLILKELGRLREITFRAVGEGSQKKRDIDQYDPLYYHIILWDDQSRQIVGSYRLGCGKQLHNKLYTRELFTYSPQMNSYFERGLELGRSFVQPKFWGSRSLDYLWQGIGAFLTQYPYYRYLFGPVSISQQLPDEAKFLLVDFYQTYYPSKSQLALAKNPIEFGSYQSPFSRANQEQDYAILQDKLKALNTSIPTLYKQYTGLCEEQGVQFLSFSIDPDFSDCIDGLILVDTEKFTDKKRQRYLEKRRVA